MPKPDEFSRAVGYPALLAGAVAAVDGLPEVWPTGVPVQIHYMRDDPFKHPGWAELVADSVRAAGAEVEAFDYDGAGHLFTDPSRPDEYDPVATDLLWQRVFAFCDRVAPIRR